MTRFAAFATVAFMALAGCASSSGRVAADGECEVAAADSDLLAAGTVYPRCAVDVPARPLNTQVQRSSTHAAESSCLRLDYRLVVSPEGRPEPGSLKILRSGSAELESAVLRSVSAWTYTPALLNGEPVRQIVYASSFLRIFGAPAEAPPQEPLAECP